MAADRIVHGAAAAGGGGGVAAATLAAGWLAVVFTPLERSQPHTRSRG